MKELEKIKEMIKEGNELEAIEAIQSVRVKLEHTDASEYLEAAENNLMECYEGYHEAAIIHLDNAIPENAIAFKLNDPIEDAGWIYDESKLHEIEQEDSGLVIYV